MRTVHGVIACLIVMGLAGCGGGGDGSSSVAKSATDKAHAGSQADDPPFGPGRAQMVGSPDTGVQSSTMARVTNGWEAHGGHRQTLVAAGVADRPLHPRGPLTTGLFSIARTRLKPFDQSGDLVEVPGAGTLTITKAPLGRRVAISAQKHGKIEFTSTNGVTGTLDLKDDTVTLDP